MTFVQKCNNQSSEWMNEYRWNVDRKNLWTYRCKNHHEKILHIFPLANLWPGISQFARHELRVFVPYLPMLPQARQQPPWLFCQYPSQLKKDKKQNQALVVHSVFQIIITMPNFVFEPSNLLKARFVSFQESLSLGIVDCNVYCFAKDWDMYVL